MSWGGGGSWGEKGRDELGGGEGGKGWVGEGG